MAVGAINSIKNVTWDSLNTLSAMPIHSAGSTPAISADTNLENADIQQVFNSAIYNLNPLSGRHRAAISWTAMDSCGAFGVTNPGTGYFTKAGPLTVVPNKMPCSTAIFTTMESISPLAMALGCNAMCMSHTSGPLILHGLGIAAFGRMAFSWRKSLPMCLLPARLNNRLVAKSPARSTRTPIPFPSPTRRLVILPPGTISSDSRPADFNPDYGRRSWPIAARVMLN